MADFSIGKLPLGDIQRTYSWDLLIPEVPGGVTEEELRIRCRSVTLPGRSNDVITSNFLGMEQFFPGKLHFTNPFNVTFEEFSDRKVAKALYAWQQTVFGISSGGGINNNKNIYGRNIVLELLDYTNANIKAIDNGRIKLFGAWPENVAEVAMSYADNAALQYSVGFRYDRWEYMTTDN
jgi:hypothetical protein